MLFRTRLHWRMYVGPVLFTLLVMGPIAVLLWMRGAPLWSPLPVALGLAWVLAAHVRRASSEFAVTNKRVVIDVKKPIEIPLTQIDDIEVDVDANVLIIRAAKPQEPVIVRVEQPIYAAALIDIATSIDDRPRGFA